jgi:hypothetical protein
VEWWASRWAWTTLTPPAAMPVPPSQLPIFDHTTSKHWTTKKLTLEPWRIKPSNLSIRKQTTFFWQYKITENNLHSPPLFLLPLLYISIYTKYSNWWHGYTVFYISPSLISASMHRSIIS